MSIYTEIRVLMKNTEHWYTTATNTILQPDLITTWAFQLLNRFSVIYVVVSVLV